jgi:hypothetical protein
MMKGDIIDKMMVMIGLGAINLPLIYRGLVFSNTVAPHERLHQDWSSPRHLSLKFLGFVSPKQKQKNMGSYGGGYIL